MWQMKHNEGLVKCGVGGHIYIYTIKQQIIDCKILVFYKPSKKPACK
jgi:hypothetical protein